jgi:hypothetical protein
MNGYAYPDRPMSTSQWRSVGACLALAALAVVAVMAVIAPTANAAPDRTVTDSFHLDQIDFYDAFLSNACGFEVVGLVEGDFERKMVFGKGGGIAAVETESFKGTITWIHRDTGRSTTDRADSTARIEFPQGADNWPLPAHVTVTGTHGGTFPFGGGPPGSGKFEYEAEIYSVDSNDIPYITPTSEATWTGHGFERATEKICAAIA